MKRIILFWLLGTVYSSEYRLPSEVIPTSYTITITLPSLSEGRECFFDGSVEIRIVSKAPLVSEVIFHVKDLEINSVSIKKDTILGRSLTIKDMEYIKELDQFVLYLEKPLEEDSRYVVKITYNGKISNDPSGFYLSSYETVNHEEK